MATEAITRFLSDKLSLLLVEEAQLLVNAVAVKDNISKTIEELEGISSLIPEADKRAERDEDVKIWVKQVAGVSFDMEDVLDEFMLRLSRLPRRRGGCFGILHKLSLSVQHMTIRHQLSARMQETGTRLHLLFEKKKKNLQDGRLTKKTDTAGSSSSIATSKADHDQPPSSCLLPIPSMLMFEEDDAVGTERARDALVRWLVKGESRVTAVSVVGMGGLGKTTLVKQVYNSHHVKKHFDCYAWINISQRFRLNKVLESLMKQFDAWPAKKQADDHIWTRMELTKQLGEYIRDKRYVIVLDDLWSIHVWEDIRYTLPDNSLGSRVIITTPNSEVAMSTYGHVYNLQPMTREDAWHLFCMKAFPPKAHCPPELEAVSRIIVKRCGGLPLGIVVAGAILRLREKDVQEWKKVLEYLRGELETNTYYRTLNRTVQLSYKDLPYFLKACLLYLSIFPEDVPIRSMRLIRLWIAEGFVQARGSETAEEVAEGYLYVLINRGLVQASELHDDGRLRSCRVPGPIYDMVQSIAREENFAVNSNTEELKLYGRMRRISVNNDFDNAVHHTKMTHLRHLRSLLVFGEKGFFFENSINWVIPSFRFLKVLDLEGIPLKRFPTAIANLLLLRYLSLRNAMITKLPKSLKNLVKIETLDLTGTYVSAVPIWILKLKRLRHLLLGHHHDMNGVSVTKEIGNLTALQTLKCIHAAARQGRDVISELGKLTQLRTLWIAGLREEDGSVLCSSIVEMKNLLTLKAMSNDDDMLPNLQDLSSPPPFLRRLRLGGRLQKLPDWLASLENLVKLSLFGSRLSDDPLKVLEDLPSLMILALIRAYDGTQLCCSAGGFPRLRMLKLVELDSLESVIMEEGAFPSLEELHIRSCGSLKNLENVPPDLKELHLYDVPEEIKKLLEDTGDQSCLPSPEGKAGVKI